MGAKMRKAKKKTKRVLLEKVACPACGKRQLKGKGVKQSYSRQLCSACYIDYMAQKRAAGPDLSRPMDAPCGRQIKPGPLGSRGSLLRCISVCAVMRMDRYWQCLSYAAARYWDGWEVV